jgi:integrase
MTVGYTPSGKRIVKRGSGHTKTDARRKLREIIREYEDEQVTGGHGYTVARAVRDRLEFGLPGRDEDTVAKCTILANTHVIPALGARKLRELSADDVDRWLADKAKTLSTSTLANLHSILKRAITRAQKRDKVRRNVVLLCDIPQGREGRPSKSLTYDQAAALPAAAASTSLNAYIVVSLLTGARTEELRAVTWSHVDLDATPPHIMVWRSIRVGGDTKTRKSRRTLELPQRCVDVLLLHRERQDQLRQRAAQRWHDNELVFASRVGTALDAGNVRRAFRKVTAAAGLDPADWTPRELRHSFVSLLSDAGVPVEKIARLVGHSGTTTTETVYRHQIRPVVTGGAEIMDQLFPSGNGDA